MHIGGIMKLGLRTPSLSKSLKAKTTGMLKRSIKKTVNPLYGKSGVGFVKDPAKSTKDKVYKKTTFSLWDLFK